MCHGDVARFLFRHLLAGLLIMRKKQHPLIVSVALVMIIVGTAMILYRVTGERMSSKGGLLLLTGVSSTAVGSMLLTQSGIAVFFYGLFAVTLLILHAVAAGVFHPLNLLPILMLIMIPPLIRALPRKRR